MGKISMSPIEVKDYRDRNKLTQAQLAEIVGVGIRAVQSWEQGKRNISGGAIKLLQQYEQSDLKEELPQEVSFEKVLNSNIVDDFYNWLQDIKNQRGLSYTKLGEPINKSGNAMRMAVIRQSLSELEKEKIKQLFGQNTQKEETPQEVRFEKVISKEVSEGLKPFLLELQRGQSKTCHDNQDIINLIKKLAVKVDEMQSQINQIDEKVSDVQEVISSK